MQCIKFYICIYINYCSFLLYIVIIFYWLQIDLTYFKHLLNCLYSFLPIFIIILYIVFIHPLLIAKLGSFRSQAFILYMHSLIFIGLILLVKISNILLYIAYISSPLLYVQVLLRISLLFNCIYITRFSIAFILLVTISIILLYIDLCLKTVPNRLSCFYVKYIDFTCGFNNFDIFVICCHISIFNFGGSS